MKRVFKKTRKILAAVFVVCVALFLGACSADNGQAAKQGRLSGDSLLAPGANAAILVEANSVGLESAKQAALNHAGVSASDAVFIKAQLDYEDGIAVFEIEFIANGVEYEYDIKAADGSVYQYSRESAQDAAWPAAGQANPNANPNTNSNANSGGYVGLETAKNAALSHAGVSASSAVFTKAQLDYEDGFVVYEIEFFAGGIEYEYDIKAADGSVYQYSREADEGGGSIGPGNSAGAISYIGVEAAKNAALSHAGVSASSAAFIKAELDYDDGRAEYDIEFYSGGLEYDYTIDAVNGNVLEFEADND